MRHNRIYKHINLLSLSDGPTTSGSSSSPLPSAPVPPPILCPLTITAFTTNAWAVAVVQRAGLISRLQTGLGNGSGLSL